MKAKHDSRNEMPEVSIDYAFPASADDVGLTMLVARDRRTRMTCSTVVPRKGTSGAFAARRLIAFLREIGADQVDVIMKSDGEAAIKAVIDDVAALRPTVRTIEVSLVRRVTVAVRCMARVGRGRARTGMVRIGRGSHRGW